MEFIIILFLLILNGIFAMYEIALVSSSKARLETLVSKGNKSAKGVLKQLEEPEKFLSTIQIGITLIGIISGAYGGVAIADDVTPLFAMIPGLELYAKDLAMVTTVAVITYLSLIIGELVPKSMALNNPERYATLLSPFMIILTKVSYPFVCLLKCFNQTDKQAYRHERRGRTADDTGRTENDFAIKVPSRALSTKKRLKCCVMFSASRTNVPTT